jgi:hypothetical protein
MKFLIVFLIPSLSFAFTLNPATGKGFKDNNIKVHIANTDCSGAGFSTSKYKKLIKDAVNEYWHKVPTSAIALDVQSIGSIDVDGYDFGNSLLDLVPINTIVAGCNDDASGFDGSGEPGGYSTTLGAAQMRCSGDNCQGVLLLNAHPTSQLTLMSDSDIKATIAHELGHAFGLGHSEFHHNLMYYSASGKQQKWLGQDDIDAVTYLYPHDAELAGLLGSCGIIDTTQGPKNFFGTFFFGIFFIWLLKIIGLLLSHFRRPKENILYT